MKKSDVICSECGAGFRIELTSSTPDTTGEFRCLVCNHLLETFDGSRQVALRLTVRPEKQRRSNFLAAYDVACWPILLQKSFCLTDHKFSGL
jgi:hypothetical protein